MNEERTVCVDPATGEVIGHSPLDTAEDARKAIERAHEAQPAWAALPVNQRVRALRRVRTYIIEHAEEIATTISRDTGKTRSDAMTTEVAGACISLSYYARKARRFLAPKRLAAGTWVLANKVSRIHRVPFGVIGIIAPWNYPFGIPMHEIVKALLAGNAVVFKTATETQMVGRAIERCLASAGLPDGVFTFLNVPGRIAGAAFLEGGVDKLFFTGSVEVGRRLMAKAAETLTPVSLELGGNDPMLVCPDADLERAAGGALWAGASSAGQSCGGIERIYVHESVHDAFVEILSRKVEALRVGKDEGPFKDMGAMTTSAQVEAVRAHVEDAVEKGATIRARSGVPEETGGLFHPAMVLTDVDHTMRVMKEETFGPLLGVMKVADMDEAVELANDCDLGLSGSVWSRSRRRARKLARRIRSGTVMINDHLMNHGLAETPWGGFRNSGIGRTHGEIGFDEMTEPQCIVDDVLPLEKRAFWWHPYDATVYHGMRGLLEFLYASSLGQKLSGLARVLKLLPRYWTRPRLPERAGS